MFRRLKLSLTWGLINNSSSDISLSLFNLYPQHTIIDVLDFSSICRYVRYRTTKRQNKEKIESYIPSTTHPTKYPLPPSSVFPSGLFRGLNPNDRPNLDPATAAYPEGRRVRFLNCIWSDTERVGEESPEGVVSQFGPGGGDKLRPELLGRYDPDLKFSTAYRNIAPIWMTSVFLVAYIG